MSPQSTKTTSPPATWRTSGRSESSIASLGRPSSTERNASRKSPRWYNASSRPQGQRNTNSSPCATQYCRTERSESRNTSIIEMNVSHEAVKETLKRAAQTERQEQLQIDSATHGTPGGTSSARHQHRGEPSTRVTGATPRVTEHYHNEDIRLSRCYRRTCRSRRSPS